VRVASRGRGSTEQRSLNEALNVMAERLDRLVRSQKQFVADASHRLCTR
jgi:signal transduction histidine kinase